MKLQIDTDGHAVVQDGKPVFVADDGKTVAFDYVATLATIARLNGEARTHRERAEAAEASAKLFDGIEDADAARKALATVRNLDDKKLVDAGEVDRVKAEAIKAVEDRYKPMIEERDGLKVALFNEKIGGSFSRSKFIADKMAIPPDLAQSHFGGAFSVEDGQVVAKDTTGNRIFSRARPGELANFDEALESLVGAYAHRDSILKGTGASGGGSSSSGGAVNGKRTVTRAVFDAMDPAAKMAAIKETAIVD